MANPPGTATNGEAEPEQPPGETPLADQVVTTKVNWDDSKMATSYELTLLFGMNQTWNTAEAKELTVELNNRILLTPYAAKRLLTLLAARMRDYETRIGPITL